MPLSSSTFLVTGGAGFIGSHLVEALLLQGARRVIALDSLHCGSWAHLDEAAARFASRLQRITLDLADASEAELLQTLQGVDYLYHLAAEKHRASLDQSAERVLTVNVTATARLFRLAAMAGVRKTIFTSSLYAYGSMKPPVMTETQLPTPQTVYGVSKLSGEHLLRWAEGLESSGEPMRTTALRLFFTYGPRQFAGMGYRSVILKHFERIRAGQPPVIFGDGEQVLDYVYVDDVVRALLLSLDRRADGETFNIGSGQATSIRALTACILAVSGSMLKPEMEPPDWTAGSWRVADCEKARRLLGWIPQVSLEEGLSRVYRWFTQT